MSFITRFIEIFKGWPEMIQKMIIVAVMFLLSNLPWGLVLGSFGSYVKAGLILGAIFLALHWTGLLGKMGEGQAKTKQKAKTIKVDQPKKEEKKTAKRLKKRTTTVTEEFEE